MMRASGAHPPGSPGDPGALAGPSAGQPPGTGLPDEARQVVSRYLSTVDAALPGLIEGLYISGSVALRDFQPAVSDVDFVAVTSEQVTGQQLDTLAGVHAEVAAEAGLRPFEGPYVTLADLVASPLGAPEGPSHHDGKLTVGNQGRHPAEWFTLARYGIAARGPDPAALAIAADPGELVTWTLKNLEDYWVPWEARSRDPQTQTAMALLTDWGVAWAVLGVSRQHYTVTARDITSKTGAGHHALATFPPRWHGIITEALRCRPVPLRVPESLEAATARRGEASDFLAFAINAIRAAAP